MKTKLFKELNLGHLDQEVMEAPMVPHGILEDDFYKFTMGEFISQRSDLHYAHVTWRFKNRTKGVSLGDYITEKAFGDEIDRLMKDPQLTSKGHHYLRGMFEYDNGKKKSMFSDEYLHYLTHNFHFPEFKFSISNDRQLDITWSDLWINSSAGELPVIKIVNGLYYRSLMSKLTRSERYAVYAQGVVNVNQKIQELKKHSNVFFSDFGNRRRFGGNIWQGYVDQVMTDELPKQFYGTSNTYLAMENGLMPIGTCAHELSMVTAALFLNNRGMSLAEGQDWLQKEWNSDWGYPLAISLPDTYGTEFCLDAYSDETVRSIKGFRADSMNPIDAINLYIERFKKAGVDPRDRMAIPSDGLDIPAMIHISDTFQDKIHISHGLGTHLTNDMGLPTLSIVGKADSVNGLPCVKLSDNRAKATGDPDAVADYIKLAGYTSNVNIEQVV